MLNFVAFGPVLKCFCFPSPLIFFPLFLSFLGSPCFSWHDSAQPQRAAPSCCVSKPSLWHLTPKVLHILNPPFLFGLISSYPRQASLYPDPRAGQGKMPHEGRGVNTAGVLVRETGLTGMTPTVAGVQPCCAPTASPGTALSCPGELLILNCLSDWTSLWPSTQPRGFLTSVVPSLCPDLHFLGIFFTPIYLAPVAFSALTSSFPTGPAHLILWLTSHLCSLCCLTSLWLSL